MSEVNVPLLRKAVEWAEGEAAKPEPQSEWHQGGWRASPRAHAMLLTEEDARGEFGVSVGKWNKLIEKVLPECGTTYCIAGYVALVLNDLEFNTSEWRDKDDLHISEVAANLLGIDPPRVKNRPEDGHLFAASNTIQDVRRIAEGLAGERL